MDMRAKYTKISLSPQNHDYTLKKDSFFWQRNDQVCARPNLTQSNPHVKKMFNLESYLKSWLPKFKTIMCYTQSYETTPLQQLIWIGTLPVATASTVSTKFRPEPVTT